MEYLKQLVVGVFTHKRMLSMYWRVADMFVVVFADVLVNTMTGLNTPQWAVVLVGLGLGEVTKFFNSKNP